jgi:hypothetical protein
MGRRPYGARCGQPPADPRPQGAQGVPGPAPPSGRPAATSTGPRPPRSPNPLVAGAPHRPPQSLWLPATAAAMPGGSAAAWRARRKKCGGGHGERRGMGGPGSSRWAPAARPPMTAARFDQRLTTISGQLLANCTFFAPAPWHMGIGSKPLRGSDRELRRLIGLLSARTANASTAGGNQTALGPSPMTARSIPCHLAWACRPVWSVIPPRSGRATPRSARAPGPSKSVTRERRRRSPSTQYQPGGAGERSCWPRWDPPEGRR